MILTLLSLAALIIRSHSCCVTASGFSQRMCLPALRRPHRVLGMLGVGRADVDGVDLLETALVVVVTRAHRNAVLVANLVQLLDAAADDGMEGGVTPRMRE